MKITTFKKILILSIFLVNNIFYNSFGQIVNPESVPASSLSSEYYVGKEYGKPLISVQLISGVNKPGVYYVPMGTNLVQLIAYAGGATDRSDIEQISIRKVNEENGDVTFLLVSLEKMLRSKSDLTILSPGDVILIPQKASIEKTLTWVNLISGIVSIGLSIAIIQDLDKRD